MNTSGRTPLLRARKIETHFGLEEIYLKLEGTNPNGHKYDRIGEIVIRDALAGGYGTVLFDGPRRYLRSVRAYAEDRGLDILVPLFKNQAWKARDFQGNQLVDLKRVSYDDRIAVIEELCEKRNVYNGATGYHNSHLSILALEEIGNELIERMEDIDSIFVQLSYGYTVSSLYNSFFREWVRGSINGYPQIYSCTIPKGNRIFEDYKQRNEIPSIDDYDIKINKYTKELYIDNTALLEESLKSVRDTSGEILGVDEQTLKEATAFLRKAEHLKVSAEEAYSFAGFYAMARAGKLKGGRHVVILNDARPDLQINRLEDYSEYSAEKLYELVDTFLMQYSDPAVEVNEAIANAMAGGAVFLAQTDGRVEGICVLARSGFEEFFPKYHLAYIGTRAGRKGRGIASSLIDEVINYSQGSVSLHVDLDNARARKLYEKFGFKSKYYRMIYQEEDA